MTNRFRVWVVGLLIVCASILSWGTVMLHDTAESSNRFLVNFSEYMHCLVVPNEVEYAKVGKDAYFAECDALLYRGTGHKSPTRAIQPTTTSTPTPTTS